MGRGMGRGMGRMASMFQNEGQAVGMGIVGVCLVGLSMGGFWFSLIADRKPGTFTPAWQAATIKYRAAQNQDPITNQ